ncbi:MAG TPA: hypothetical protein VJ385_04490 [Fibrobacteria bacterium]|nr:hypothetical protein [Fibrobacteria bacterium]
MRMPWPIENTFELLRADAPDELTPGDSLARMQAHLKRLPPGSSSYFLECRLAKDDDRVDFGACFRSPLDSATAPAGKPGFAAPSGNRPEDKAWEPVNRAFSLWASRTSGLRNRVPYIWIEMDQAGPQPGAAVPGFLFCVDPSLARVPERFQAGPDGRKDLLAIAREIEKALFGSGLPAGCGKTLWDCLTALPAEGRILHISAMPSRSPAALKLNICMPKKALFGFLRRIRWPGSPAELEKLWEAFHPFMSCAKIDLEISAGVSPRLGLELHPYNTPRTARKAALLRLARSGSAQPRKARALAAWCGNVTRMFPGHRWPTHMVKEFGLKLVFAETRPLQAKGYLGYYPIFSLR